MQAKDGQVVKRNLIDISQDSNPDKTFQFLPPGGKYVPLNFHFKHNLNIFSSLKP